MTEAIDFTFPVARWRCEGKTLVGGMAPGVLVLRGRGLSGCRTPLPTVVHRLLGGWVVVLCFLMESGCTDAVSHLLNQTWPSLCSLCLASCLESSFGSLPSCVTSHLVTCLHPAIHLSCHPSSVLFMPVYMFSPIFIWPACVHSSLSGWEQKKTSKIGVASNMFMLCK